LNKSSGCTGSSTISSNTIYGIPFSLDEESALIKLNMTTEEINNIYSLKSNQEKNISHYKKYKIISKKICMAIRAIFKNIHNKDEHKLVMDKQYCEEHFTRKYLINYYFY